MKIYALRAFARRARKLGIDGAELLAAVARIERGSIDAHLGSGLIKQRISRDGRGKAGSARAVLFHKQEHLVVFIHVFLKADQADLQPRELETLRAFARDITALGARDIAALLDIGEWSQIA